MLQVLPILRFMRLKQKPSTAPPIIDSKDVGIDFLLAFRTHEGQDSSQIKEFGEQTGASR
jgi:hypothetical protein